MANSFHNSILVLIVVTLAFCLNPLHCKHHGFTVDLIRRYQPNKSISSSSSSSSSNSYSNSSSYFEWLAESFERSLSRNLYYKNALNLNHNTPSNFDSPLTSIGGDYAMEVLIGNPPVKIAAIADTGSDVSWTQCNPCIKCYKQNDPLFDSTKSVTYQKLSCDSPQCGALQYSTCDDSNECTYEVIYGDKSRSIGDLASDTFHFATSYFANTTFGCAHDNSGTFNESVSGIIGLGGGQLSIVNQFSEDLSKKFSYCLVPIDEPDSTSKISFGYDTIPKGTKGAVSTPLIKGKADTFYYITLEGVSAIGHTNNASSTTRILLKDEEQEGNIIIDSGTTLTFLPAQMYHDLKALITSYIGVETIPDPNGILDLCYRVVDGGSSNIKFVDLLFHFKGGDVLIPSKNSFIEASIGVVCFTMLPANEIALIGNLSQMDFLVEYDIENAMLSFLPTDCAKFH